MAKGDFLGEFEIYVMLALTHLAPEAYGVTIAREIEKAGGREVAVASLYLTLDRLEANGLIRSELGEPTPERGGRAKTFFRATAFGVQQVRDARRMLSNMWDGVPALETM